MDYLTKKITTNFRSLSKYAAALFIILYGCGFLVFSLHTARYGFFETNPLKSRVLATGLLFVLFSIIPNFALRGASVTFEGKISSIENFRTLALASLRYFIICVCLAQPFSRLFEKGQKIPEITWQSLMSISIISLSLAATSALLTRIFEIDVRYPKSAIGLYLFTLATGLLFTCLYSPYFPSFYLALWFFTVGTLLVYTNHCLKQDIDLDFSNVLLPALIIGIAVYSTTLYPKINFSWGGGSSIPATVLIEENSQVFPTRSLRGHIIDQSDDGVFFIPNTQKRALYIPAKNIEAIFYSTQPLYLETSEKEIYGPWPQD